MKQTIAVALCFLAFLSCKKLDKEVLANKSNIKVLGHGGTGFISMENTVEPNTLPALELGIDEYGADGAEMDIRLSKDNKIFLYHNKLLQDLTNCEGKIANLTAEEISKCQYITIFYNNPLRKYNVITLETVFERFKNYNPKPVFSLDTKLSGAEASAVFDTAFAPRFAERLTALITRYDMVENVIVESSSIDFLKNVKVKIPQIKTIYNSKDLEKDLPLMLANNISGLMMSEEDVTAEQVKKAQEAGLIISLYGKKTYATNKSAISKLPDYLQTDLLDYTLSVVKK